MGSRMPGFHDRKDHPFALPHQLLSHFIRDHASSAGPYDEIGSFWPKATDLLDVMRGHLLHTREWSCLAIEPTRLKPIDWLLLAQLFSEPSKDQNVTADARDNEDWRPRAPWSNGHQRVPANRASFLAEDFGEQLDRWRLKQQRHRQSLAQCLLDCPEDLQRQQGVASEVEEIVPHSDRGHAQDLLPDRGQLQLQPVPWCHAPHQPIWSFIAGRR